MEVAAHVSLGKQGSTRKIVCGHVIKDYIIMRTQKVAQLKLHRRA